jgi:hypothetical protein
LESFLDFDGPESFSGGNSGKETPVPIPNTEVKLSSADGTAGFLWESRTLPGFHLWMALANCKGHFLYCGSWHAEWKT